MTQRAVSALCITHTSPSPLSSHLSPFASGCASTSDVDGFPVLRLLWELRGLDTASRVRVGLATRRPSRDSVVGYVIARGRQSVRSLRRPHWPLSRPSGATQHWGDLPRTGSVPFSDAVTARRRVDRLGTDFKQCSFCRIARVLRGSGFSIFSPFLAFRPCYGPLGLSAPGKAGDPRICSPSFPPVAGIPNYVARRTPQLPLRCRPSSSAGCLLYTSPSPRDS